MSGRAARMRDRLVRTVLEELRGDRLHDVGGHHQLCDYNLSIRRNVADLAIPHAGKMLCRSG